MQKAIVKSWLPVFPGFYGTAFDTSLDDGLEYELKGDGLSEAEISEIYSLDCYDKAYKTYRLDVINEYVQVIFDILRDCQLVTSMAFEKLVSPKEYNFQNDSADIAYELSKNNVSNIKTYLKAHQEAWQKFIYERYKPASGYIPYYDNDINSDDWNLEHAICSAHGLGTIFEFILGTLQNDHDNITMMVLENTSFFVSSEAIRLELKAKGFYNTCPECGEEQALYDVNEIRGAFYVKRACKECAYKEQISQVSKGQMSLIA